MSDLTPDRQPDAWLVADAASATELAVSLLGAMPDCVKLLDLDGRLDHMSFSGLCLMEIDDFEAVRGRRWWELWPEDAREGLRAAVERAGDGRTTRLTAFCPTAKGTPKWWDVSVSPVRDAAGRIRHVLSVSRDVTAHVDARREVELALERASLLLREIDHRVKNSLMLIVSLLRIQSRQVADPAAVRALAEAAQRVGTVARVHDRLYRADSAGVVPLGDYLGHLCADLDGAFRGSDPRGIRLESVDLMVDADTAVAVGLVVAELVSNAHRHGGLGSEVRTLVRLRVDEGGARGLLAVSDDGRGLPADFAADSGTGVGMRVVQAKCQELGGTLRHGRGPEGGALFEMGFPLAAAPAG